jgi:hypothetical protein
MLISIVSETGCRGKSSRTVTVTGVRKDTEELYNR